MLVRAIENFASTAFPINKNEVKECSDKAILQDLLQAGYVEEAKQEKTTPKGGKVNESKRNNK